MRVELNHLSESQQQIWLLVKWEAQWSLVLLERGTKKRQAQPMVLKTLDQDWTAEIWLLERQIKERWILRAWWEHPHVNWGSHVNVGPLIFSNLIWSCGRYMTCGMVSSCLAESYIIFFFLFFLRLSTFNQLTSPWINLFTVSWQSINKKIKWPTRGIRVKKCNELCFCRIFYELNLDLKL